MLSRANSLLGRRRLAMWHFARITHGPSSWQGREVSEIPKCRAIDPDGKPCQRERGHRYNDAAENNNTATLHVSASGGFRGGIKTPAVYPAAPRGRDENYTEADYATWLRL